MSDFSTLKEEIMNWAMLPHAMKEFTTHDVYDAIHSAETSSKASDALRRLFKDGKLNRRESVDGNRKIFFYSLKNDNVIYEEKVIPKESLFSSSIKPAVNLVDTTKDFNIPITMKKSNDVSINQQIEIPNNFVIELKTPNGFTITIRGGNENTN